MIRPVRRAPHALPVRIGTVVMAALLGAAAAPPVRAHGLGDDLPVLDVRSALTIWSVDLPLTLVLIGLAGAYLLGVRAIGRRHPGSPVARWRSAAWLGGLAVVAIALEGSVDVYAEALFSVHMVQHLLLVAVAAPLFALAAPGTLLLRWASPGVRRGLLLPLLHSRIVGVVTHPLVSWLSFAAVMWISHFSPLFDAALEEPLVHQFEHGLYLGTAMLFWWPVVGADPVQHRLGWAGRLVYLGTALPWNSFLGVAIYFAPDVLYPHYATVVRDWGPAPLLDQQAAGAIMWVGGDLAFLVALLLVVAGLLADEERKGRIYDARMDAARR
jgi:putative copper resistance protein D